MFRNFGPNTTQAQASVMSVPQWGWQWFFREFQTLQLFFWSVDWSVCLNNWCTWMQVASIDHNWKVAHFSDKCSWNHWFLPFSKCHLVGGHNCQTKIVVLNFAFSWKNCIFCKKHNQNNWAITMANTPLLSKSTHLHHLVKQLLSFCFWLDHMFCITCWKWSGLFLNCRHILWHLQFRNKN